MGYTFCIFFSSGAFAEEWREAGTSTVSLDHSLDSESFSSRTSISFVGPKFVLHNSSIANSYMPVSEPRGPEIRCSSSCIIRSGGSRIGTSSCACTGGSILDPSAVHNGSPMGIECVCCISIHNTFIRIFKFLSNWVFHHWNIVKKIQSCTFPAPVAPIKTTISFPSEEFINPGFLVLMI